MLTVEGKLLGRKKPLFADWSVPLPADLCGSTGPTLGKVIERIVRLEVEAFRERQQERRLLKALTAGQIEKAVIEGKVDSGGADLEQSVDEGAAVEAALQAFRDGLYLVALDGQELRDLNQPAALRPDSRITFVRLTMLAGG